MRNLDFFRVPVRQIIIRLFGILFASAWFVFVICQWLARPENSYSITGGIQIIWNFLAVGIWQGVGQYFLENFIYNSSLMFLASFLVLAMYGYGRFCLLKFLNSEYAPVEKFIFSSALGTGIMGNIVLLLAACHILFKPVLLITVACGIVLFLKSVRSFPIEKPSCPDSTVGFIKEKICKLSLFDICLLLIIFSSLLMCLLSIFTPDMRDDTLNYHLSVPAWYLMNHGIADMPHNIYYNLFALYACVYAAAMGISDYMLPRAVNFLIVISGTLIMPAYLAGRYFGRKYILPTLAIICATYQFDEMAFLTGSDSFSVFFVLAMISAVLVHKQGDRRTLCLAAIFAGFAMATKATSIAFVIPAMPIMFAANGIKTRENLKNVFVFVSIASLPVIPWLVKNLIFRGNPFFPFMTGIFGLSPEYDPVLIRHFKNATNLLAGHSFHAFKTVWNIFFATHTGYNILASPFMIALAGFVPFCFKKPCDKRQKQIMFFALLSFVLMLPSSGIFRFYLPVYAVMAIFYAYCLYDAQEKHWLIRLPIVLTLAFCLVPSVFMFKYHAFYEVPAGNMTRTHYLRSRFGYTDAVLWANANIPEKSKILISDLIGRSFYCERPYFVSSLFDKYWHETALSGNENPEEILDIMRKQGFTHILHNSDKLDFSPSLTEYRHKRRNERSIIGIRQFAKKYLRPIYVSPLDNTVVYEILYEALDKT